ncbi:hypothetical protein [Edaphobacter aggregans]|uniref:hypothetical protein n=1 Tax=Edaphobacter aggregans TaxID=570835 RepID=UPI00054CFC8F|nr:hypothetical protein [Edaphobacter aggregans]
MDSVRFGRALGVGARAAAKTLLTAVDAAASPNPSAQKPNTGASSRPAAQSGSAAVAQQVVRTAAQARQATAGVAQGGKRFGEAVWRPLVKLSGVLWLEFTGVFFGIFAAYAGGGAWKLRAEWRETATNHDMHMHFLMAAGMALLFGYFCVTSFVRAGRRGR